MDVSQAAMSWSNEVMVFNPPNRIKAIRESRGMTLDALAERVGTSNQQISRLQSGERNLTHAWMVRLADALGCRPGDFLPLDHQPALTDQNADMPILKDVLSTILGYIEQKNLVLNTDSVVFCILDFYKRERTADLAGERDRQEFGIQTGEVLLYQARQQASEEPELGTQS